MRVAFGTVVYPKALRYSSDYAQSINSQVGREFDVLLVSDGLSYLQRNDLQQLLRRKTIWDIPSKQLSIPDLRIELLKAAYRYGYDVLVLGDFDDTYAPTRVQTMANNLTGKQAFCYHNLDVEGHPLFSHIPSETNTIEQIIDSNYLGFGNTAINLQNIPIGFINSLSGAPEVFDWYFYTLLLLTGKSGIYIPECLTNYRIYSGNMAGVQSVTPRKVREEVTIKRRHYTALRKRDEVFSIRMKAYSIEKPSISWRIIGPKNGRWWSLTQPIL